MQHFRDDRESSMPALAMEFRFDAGLLVSMPIGMPEVVVPVPEDMRRTFGVPTRTQSGHSVAREPASQTCRERVCF